MGPVGPQLAGLLCAPCRVVLVTVTVDRVNECTACALMLAFNDSYMYSLLIGPQLDGMTMA